MNINKAKKIQEVFNAFCEGKEIQCLTVDNRWKDITNPTWDSYEYRIKPLPKLRPFTEDELVGKLKNGMGYLKMIKPYRIVMICAIISDSIYIQYNGSMKSVTSYKELMENYTFLDDSPCGVIE